MTAKTVGAVFETSAENMQMRNSQKSKGAEKSTDFGQMLSQYQSKSPVQNVASNTTEKAATEKKDASAQQNTVKQQNTDTKVDKSKEAKVSQELKDKISSIEEKIKEAIKKALGVSDEELENAMALFGFNFTDLLDTDQFTQLFLSLTGNENMLTLITDENLYQSFRQLTELLEGFEAELLEEFDLTQEELNTVFSLLEQTEGPKETFSAAIGAAAETEEKEPQVSEEENSGQEFKAAEEKELPAADTSGADSSKKDMSGESSKEEMNFMQSENRTVIHHSPAEHVVYTQKTDSYGIVQQVVEQVKVMVKEDLTSLEMQLNPESLGKLTLQVTSRQGVITAQLEVRTDAAKDLVEAQMAQLKESMNQQGLKIEAVEVTIASHAFESNLEQKDQSGEEPKQQKKSSENGEANGIGLEEAEEEESVEDTIRRANGNVVNFKA